MTVRKFRTDPVLGGRLFSRAAAAGGTVLFVLLVAVRAVQLAIPQGLTLVIAQSASGVLQRRTVRTAFSGGGRNGIFAAPAHRGLTRHVAFLANAIYARTLLPTFSRRSWHPGNVHAVSGSLALLRAGP